MRAVVGSVTSSKPISLSKAASVLSRFAAGDAGAGREVGAYIRRASAAFTDLVEFHRKPRDDLHSADEAGEEKDPKTPIQTRAVEANGVVDASSSENRSKKKKKREREPEVVENGGQILEDEKRKKKKRKHSSTEKGGAENGVEIRREEKKMRKNAATEDQESSYEFCVFALANGNFSFV